MQTQRPVIGEFVRSCLMTSDEPMNVPCDQSDCYPRTLEISFDRKDRISLRR